MSAETKTSEQLARAAVRGRAGGYLCGAELVRSVAAAIREAVAAENEWCAKAADEAAELWRVDTPGRGTAEAIARAIRERRP